MKVYFNGVAVSAGDTLTVQTVLNETSLAVEGVESYTVTTATADDTTTYTIAYGQGETFVFSVKTDIAEQEAEQGCNSTTGAMATLVAVAAVAFALWMNGKKNTEGHKAEQRYE